DGWSNNVRLAPAHVVRISPGRFRDSFAHEARILRLLPPEVPHAAVVAQGRVGKQEWLVLERVTGVSLMVAWPALTTEERTRAARELGTMLRALHEIRIPADLRNPWLDDALAPGGPRRDAYHAPPTFYRELVESVQGVPGIDRSVLDEIETFIAQRLDAFEPEPEVLVHADLHFANLLWHDGHLSALLDFESARPAPRDLELATLLRFVRERRSFDPTSPPNTWVDVGLPRFVDALADAYPELFAHPRLGARIAVYEALWRLVQLHHFPPGSGPPDPWGHLVELIEQGDRWEWR
ncbi:MAG TPA: phosphotransferase, partial [Chloroflexota bacterium]|nr:phosphotransferase [Chloroflexota bacterium]